MPTSLLVREMSANHAAATGPSRPSGGLLLKYCIGKTLSGRVWGDAPRPDGGVGDGVAASGPKPKRMRAGCKEIGTPCSQQGSSRAGRQKHPGVHHGRAGDSTRCACTLDCHSALGGRTFWHRRHGAEHRGRYGRESAGHGGAGSV